MKKINTILTFHVLAQLPTNALVGHVLAIFCYQIKLRVVKLRALDIAR